MGVEAPQGIVAPNFRTPRLLGIFSVVFASELLIAGICMGGYVSIMPMFSRMMDATTTQLEAQGKTRKAAELAALAEKEKAAKTDEQKIEIAAERKAIEARPLSPMAGAMDVNKVTMGDPAFIGYSWADVVSGIVLNVLLLASGIGLLSWRPWARTLGVWTAFLKIVRLVVVYGYFVIVIVPPYCERLGKVVEEMMTSQGTPAPVGGGFFVKMYTVMYTGMGLGMMLIGAIYPAILLWLLTRPAVKSACSGRWKTPKEPNQPC
jgi:hypothetical protein